MVSPAGTDRAAAAIDARSRILLLLMLLVLLLLLLRGRRAA
jgi:hypothetical protein